MPRVGRTLSSGFRCGSLAALRSIAAALLVASIAAAVACGGRSEPAPPSPDPRTERAIAEGQLVGFETEAGAHAWRGIPFAKPPVGPLRWRAPLPPQPWPGRLEALRFASVCAQIAGPGGAADGAGPGDPTGSEDCLYLNVYAPPFDPTAVPAVGDRLPVMVWIHGGGNSVGDATLYDGSHLARAHDVIVVTLQYRLGLLGWFAHRSLRGSGATADDRSGNFGTLDLAMALRWVRRNISFFGGDPDRVTVFGESAGATNVFSLMLSPRARGLFHGAIAQSGGAWTCSTAQAENAIDAAPPGRELSSSEILLRLLERDGRAADREGATRVAAAMSDSETAAYLYAKTPAELLGVVGGDSFGGMYMSPNLLRDGAVLPSAEPQSVFTNADRYNAVPVILGTNRDEDKLFLAFSSPAVTRFFGFPVYINDADFYDASAEYQTLMWKATGVDEPAAAMRSAQGASVFAYRFDWDEEPSFLWLDFSELLGAAHALEIPFVFGHLSLGPATRVVFDEARRPAAERLSRRMMSYWAEFAYSGEPGRGRDGREPHWQPWNAADGHAPKYLVFDTEDGNGVRMASEIRSREELIAGVLADPRLSGWAERCAILRSFVQWAERMDRAAYESVGDGACRAYPLDEPAGP